MINTIDPQGITAPANVIPAVNTMVDNIPASPLLNVGPKFFFDTTMTDSFPLVSPPQHQMRLRICACSHPALLHPNNNRSCNHNTIHSHNIIHSCSIMRSRNHNLIPTYIHQGVIWAPPQPTQFPSFFPCPVS